MSADLKGKVVVVTGASSGIGRAAALMFAKEGARVAGVARRTVPDFECVSADVSDEAAVNAAFAEIIKRHGGIDILVNCAGMGISGAAEETPLTSAEEIFGVNFFGAFNAVKAALPALRARGGRIINVGSVAAELAIPFQSFYSATKAALLAFSRALDNEVSPFGVKVSCLLPGDVKTGFTAARVKNPSCSEAYGRRAARSVAVMERDEQRGMPPEAVARRIVAVARKKRPPLTAPVGAKYGFFLFLKRLLPERAVNFTIGRIYG